MKTKIIATLGPASMDLRILKKFASEGVDVLRLNSKYISFGDFVKVVRKIRRVGKFKVMVDLKDRGLIPDYVDADVDYVAISFAECGSEIKRIKKMFPKRVKVIAKVETKRGLDRVDDLIAVSDGIMIARGDLGRDISIERVPVAQKLITKMCNAKNKMSITATELMPSMVSWVRPSRAEVSDIANAVLEGADALMLSEETAVGKHPVLVVKFLKRVIIETEKNRRLVG